MSAITGYGRPLTYFNDALQSLGFTPAPRESVVSHRATPVASDTSTFPEPCEPSTSLNFPFTSSSTVGESFLIHNFPFVKNVNCGTQAVLLA